MSVIGYNTKLVKAEDAPKSFADLLDPKWSSQMVKAHPGYSGTIMTATFELTRDLGWEISEAAKQKVMQVQSSTEPPKKLAHGERSMMVDGNEYNTLILKEAGLPVEIIYPAEGTRWPSGRARCQERAQSERGQAVQRYMITPECQQLLIEVGALRSFHPPA